jgi:transcriptional regulator GlxA family with amidase domain
MKRATLIAAIVLSLAAGFLLGAAAIHRPIANAPAEPPVARHPWNPKDVMGLIGSVGRPETLAALRARAADTLLVSVCTGGMILGASGVLDGKAATTKREVVPPELPPIGLMRERHPRIDVREASLVDAGTVITGGGVSLCIDAMLHLLKRLYGEEMARETARILDYHRAWSANLEQFPPLVNRR